MWRWMRKSTEATKPARNAGSDDGVVDVPVRAVMAAVALGMLVGALAAPTESGSADAVSLGQPVTVQQEGDRHRGETAAPAADHSTRRF